MALFTSFKPLRRSLPNFINILSSSSVFKAAITSFEDGILRGISFSFGSSDSSSELTTFDPVTSASMSASDLLPLIDVCASTSTSCSADNR